MMTKLDGRPLRPSDSRQGALLASGFLLLVQLPGESQLRSDEPVTAHRRLRHGLHRPAGVRDHHPAPAVLCGVVRGARLHASAMLVDLVLADAVHLRAHLGALVGSRGPAADHPVRPDRVVPVVPGVRRWRARCPLLFAARIFAGIAGANIPTAQAVVADITTPENRAKGMGMIGAAFGLGFIFGPAIGGFLSRYGYAMPAFFASALSLANFIAAWFLLPETLKPEHRAIERVGRLDALQGALAQAAPAAPAGHRLPGRRRVLRLRIHLRAVRGTQYGFHASTIGYIFAFVGVVLVIVQGFLVGKVGEAARRAPSRADIARACGDRPADDPRRRTPWRRCSWRNGVHGRGHGLQQPGADVARLAATPRPRTRAACWGSRSR